jgi:osmotically-inducible protein OsmY
MKTFRSITTAFVLLVTCGTLILASGCAGTATRQSTGEFFDDAALTAKVKATLLQDPVVSGLDVGVDTFKGQVQLNGFVDTPEQKARAEQLARTVNGVTGVGNKLTVKTQVAR